MEKKLYSMTETCKLTGTPYETLKYYCNIGLVPNVKRDSRNRRVFNDHDVGWIKSLSCLKQCGFSIQEMKRYLSYCLEGKPSIPARKIMLDKQRKILEAELESVKSSIAYIDWKEQFYDDVEAGKVPYRSDLLPEETEENHQP